MLQQRSMSHFDFLEQGAFYQMSLEKEETVRVKIENQEIVYLNEVLDRYKSVRQHDNADMSQIKTFRELCEFLINRIDPVYLN